MNRARTWSYLWVAWWFLAFTLTHLPPGKLGMPLFSGADKVVHFGLFLVLSLLGGGARRSARGRLSVGTALWLGLLLTSYAALDEGTQRYVGRTPSVYDWFADVAGIVIGEIGRAHV